MSDARDLNDRELLLLVYDDVQEIKRDLLGPDGLVRRVSVVETRVDERTTKKAQYGVPAGFSALAILLYEIAKAKVGIGGS